MHSSSPNEEEPGTQETVSVTPEQQRPRMSTGGQRVGSEGDEVDYSGGGGNSFQSEEPLRASFESGGGGGKRAGAGSKQDAMRRGML